VHGVLDAPSYEQAEAALVRLGEHSQGAGLARVINEQFDHLLAHTLGYFQGLAQVAPQWCWRDLSIA
jgi:hypothetical protein